jgi:hypothetical protein
LQNHYDVTIITVRPATQPNAIAALERSLAKDPTLLACWYSEIGALNQIMIIRTIADPAVVLESRMALINSDNPYGVGEFMTGMTMDTFVAMDFLPPMRPGKIGPCFEVRGYTMHTAGWAATVELWRKFSPARGKISTILTGMTAATGRAIRFMHIWPYSSLDERARMRAKAVAEGVWPPPGGGPHMATQHTDIYLPTPFSPIH